MGSSHDRDAQAPPDPSGECPIAQGARSERNGTVGTPAGVIRALGRGKTPPDEGRGGRGYFAPPGENFLLQPGRNSPKIDLNR
jgi:hypothetical protein